MNQNENISLVINAPIFSSDAVAFVANAALAAIANGTALPAELSDLFTLEVFTRLSGSKYGVIDAA